MASSGGAGTTRTLDQSASSSSAMISGSEVIEPWPISVAADMIVMVPSPAMLTQGDIAFPLRSAASVAARPLPPSVMAKDRPAAPIMTWRRDHRAFKLWMPTCCVIALALPRRALNGADDALIGPAAADVGAHMFDDFFAGRRRLLSEQVGRAHDLAGLAIAALRHALGEPGLLQRMRRIRRETLDRRHCSARDLVKLRLAGEGALAVNMHHAGTAQACPATKFGAGQLETFPDHPQQRCLARRLARRRLTVDREIYGHAPAPRPVAAVASAALQPVAGRIALSRDHRKTAGPLPV